MLRQPVRFLVVGWIACLTAVALGTDRPVFHLPDGFVIELVAGPPEIQFPMFACFDDRGRLYVAESSGLDLYAEITKLTRKCRVSVLEDRDGDGKYERSHVYADKLVFPMGLAWRDNRLFLPDGPELIALEDRDGDDVADTRTVLLDGFGHLDNGALHGQVFGPDGLLYGTMGSPDGYKITQADGTVIQSHTGVLLRSRSDGSRPEVLARGFTNLIEVDFLPTGEIVGSNTWIQEPVGGLRDSLVHLVEGGVYGYWKEMEGDTPPLLTGPKLPPLSIMPATSCSGVALCRGTQFPPEMRGNLFVAQFNTRSVTRHVLSRSGSTFRSQDLDFLTSEHPDFHPADVLEDADGSLLVLDTGAWYVQHCPTGSIRVSPAKGAVYRIRYTRSKPPADPRGHRIDWRSASEAELARLLRDPRFEVRRRAAVLLGRRGVKAVAPLAGLLRGETGDTSKQHAIWALTSIEHPSAVAPLVEVLAGEDTDLAALAARANSRRHDKNIAPQLHKLLGDDALHVRMAAAEALVHCGNSESVPLLLDALTRDPDRFLQHMLTVALHRLADRQALQTALEHSHPQVQKAAMLLLDQPPYSCLGPAAVVARASAADGDLRSAARTILQSHPEWGAHAVDLARQWLRKTQLTEEEEAGLRSFILAFQTNPAIREAVARAMEAPAGRLPSQRRILLLETIAQSNLADVPKLWENAVAEAVNHPSEEVREQAVRTLGTLQIDTMDDGLARIADDPKQPDPIRVEALRAIIRRRPGLSEQGFQLLLSRLNEDRGPIERLAAGEVIAQAQLDASKLRSLIEAVAQDPVIAPTVVLNVFERSQAAETAPQLIDYLVQCLNRGWIMPEQRLKRVLAAIPAGNSRAEAQKSLRDAQQSTNLKDQAARLAKYEPLLTGGDVARGKKLYFGKATCSTCHLVGNEGGTVGPDLTTIGTVRSGRDLIESLVIPGATIAQHYETYVVITDEGKMIQGILARQSQKTIFLYDAAGAELRLRTEQIDEMEVSRASLMPDGLLSLLTREEIRDLTAYLQDLK